MATIFASLPTPGLIIASLSRFFSHWLDTGDKTVPGTTDTIVLMGILIVLIIVIPIAASRRRWMR